MDALSPELYQKCRHILLKCEEFQSNESLRSIFIVDRLNAYRSKLPEADSIDARVDQCIAFLYQEHWEGESAFAFFLEVLRDRYTDMEERHNSLNSVAKEIRALLNNVWNSQKFQVIIRYCNTEEEWVENLTKRLKESEHLTVHLDKWIMAMPTSSWQPIKKIYLHQTDCCVICIGGQTPLPWVDEVTQEALSHQNKYAFFRIIPVLLPEVKVVNVTYFPDVRNWADFRDSSDHNYAFRILTHGIRGVPLGKSQRDVLETSSLNKQDLAKYKLRTVNEYKEEGLIDEVEWKESKRKILDKYLLIDD